MTDDPADRLDVRTLRSSSPAVGGTSATDLATAANAAGSAIADSLQMELVDPMRGSDTDSVANFGGNDCPIWSN